MPDLQDGESVEMQGSAHLPYVLKNVGGVYSCNCPSWRHQSLPIERRTCKHLVRLRGAEAEAARIAATVRAPQHEYAVRTTAAKEVPPLLLAESWDQQQDPTGWWMSEKLDGVRAWWTGVEFRSRQGNVYHAPHWFTVNLPSVPLDGELWLDRKASQRTVSIVRRHDQSDQWREIKFLVFDAPSIPECFERRWRFVSECIAEYQPAFALAHRHERCEGWEHLQQSLDAIDLVGGEGLMLRQPESRYEAGRSATLQKVKRFHDAEARVIEHLSGTGRHKGRMGALLVQLADGTQFSVGTGFSDAQRNSPPGVDSTITFRYQELSDRGVPRFPCFVRVRTDSNLMPA